MTTVDKYECTLDEVALATAAEQLKEDPNTRAIEVNTLRQRLQKTPGLNPRLDTGFLLRFLRARKFDQELAYQLVIKYYTTRRDEPDIFRDLRPYCVKHVFDTGYCIALGIADKEGARIILERPGKWDFNRFSEVDLIKADCLTVSKVIEEEAAQVYGIALLVDYSEFSLSHLTHTPPSFAGRLCRLWQEVFPARLRAVHILHEPAYFSTVFGLFAPFLRNKLLDRIHFHGNNLESLHTFVDKHLLPQAYGGDQPDLLDTCWSDVILGHDKEFENDSKFGMVEKVKAHTGGVAGACLPGTFKKLE